MRYVVQITDSKGKSFRVRLNIPFMSSNTDAGNSSWLAIDVGSIKAKSGVCQASEDSMFGPTHIWLMSGGSNVLILEDMFDSLGSVNSSGGGSIRQVRCLKFTPGTFSWQLLE